MTYLDRLQLTLFRAKLASPTSFRLRIRLDASLKLINLLPLMIKLFPHIFQLIRDPRLCFSTSLVKVELDLTQGFQARDKVVMENAEIRERLGLCLSSFLL
jgi:hypothetical protein